MLFAFSMPGTTEMIILLVLGLLLFGGRLPEVGRSIGKSLVEFRKGLRGLKEDVGLGELDNVRREMRDIAHDALQDADRQAREAEVVDTEARPVEPATPAADAPASEAPPTHLASDMPAAGDETASPGQPPAFGYRR
jgi:sec-independent protein translocase protein TatA